MKKEEIIKIINEKYASYQGYVQFSHRPIDMQKDIFKDGKKVEVANESGFIYEAHFYNGVDSITIKQINDSWLINETKNTPLSDTQTYHAIGGLKVKMAQVWIAEADEFCNGMMVKKLKKVVFAGFEGDKK